MSEYKVSVEKNEYKVVNEGGQFYLDGKPFPIDIVKLRDGHFHVIHNQRSYQAEIVKINSEEKEIILKVNNNVYDLKVKDRYDELLHEMGMDSANHKKVNDIKAPMPGLVLKVMVEPGQQINKGDALVILEAMKMENILKAPSDGTVKKILVTNGDKVEKNQVMVNLN